MILIFLYDDKPSVWSQCFVREYNQYIIFALYYSFTILQYAQKSSLNLV
jgi:hypothetical protein